MPDRAGYYLGLLVRSREQAMGEPMTLLGAAGSWEHSADRLVASGTTIADGYEQVVDSWKGAGAEASTARVAQTSEPLFGRPEAYRATATTLRQGASHLTLGRYQHTMLVDGYAKAVNGVNDYYRRRYPEFARYPNGVQTLTAWRDDSVEKIGQRALGQSNIVNRQVEKGLGGLAFEQPRVVLAQAGGALRLAPYAFRVLKEGVKALPRRTTVPLPKGEVPMHPGDLRYWFRDRQPVPNEQPGEQCQTQRQLLTDGTVEQETPGGTKLVGYIDNLGVFEISDTDSQALTSDPTDPRRVDLTTTTRGVFVASGDYGPQSGSMFGRLYDEEVGDRLAMGVYNSTTSLQVREGKLDDKGNYCDYYPPKKDQGRVEGDFDVTVTVTGDRLTRAVASEQEFRPPLSDEGTGNFSSFENRFDRDQYGSDADYSGAEQRDRTRAAGDTNELDVLRPRPSDRNPADPGTVNRIRLHGSGELGEQVKGAFGVTAEPSDNDLGGEPDGSVTSVDVEAHAEVNLKRRWWQLGRQPEVIRLNVGDWVDATGVEMPRLPPDLDNTL